MISQDAEPKIFSLGWYFPVNKDKESFLKDKLSTFILNGIKIKSSAYYFDKGTRDKAYNLFKTVLKTLFLDTNIVPDKKDLIFLVVPSSTANNTEHGISLLMKQFIIENDLPDCLHYLERTTSILKAAGGIHHEKDKHLKTLKITDSEVLLGKTVIIIDDVITTGNAMIACYELIKRVLPDNKVICLTLGKTIDKSTKPPIIPPEGSEDLLGINDVKELKDIKALNNKTYCECRGNSSFLIEFNENEELKSIIASSNRPLLLSGLEAARSNYTSENTPYRQVKFTPQQEQEPEKGTSSSRRPSSPTFT